MLDSLHIKNFRCFEDLTIPSLGRVNLIVGKNNSGKSTLLEAMYIFSHKLNVAIDGVLDDRNDSLDGLFNYQSISDYIYIGDISESKKIYINRAGRILGYLPDKSNKESANEKPNNAGRLRINKYNYSFIGTNLIPEYELAYLWDKAVLNSDDEFIKDILKIINPLLVNVFFIEPLDNKRKHSRIAIAKIKNGSKGVPLRGMGEGVMRLLQMFLHALNARGCYLMIDEFENGLHYSIQEEIWEKLFELAKALDIQVFATTHSQDTLRAFGHVALRSPEEGKIISLARHTRDNDPKKGQISALVYDENDIEMILQTNMEVR